MLCLQPFRSAVQQSLKQAKKRGVRAFNRGNFDESARWFSEALMLGESAPDVSHLSSDKVSLLLHRASAWSKMGAFQQAVEDTDMALTIEPFSPRALVKKGKALLHMQQYADASEAFIAALERDPGDVVRVPVLCGRCEWCIATHRLLHGVVVCVLLHCLPSGCATRLLRQLARPEAGMAPVLPLLLPQRVRALLHPSGLCARIVAACVRMCVCACVRACVCVCVCAIACALAF